MADAAEKENIFLFVPNIIGEYFCVSFVWKFRKRATNKIDEVTASSTDVIHKNFPLLLSHSMNFFFVIASYQNNFWRYFNHFCLYLGYGRIVLAVIAFYFMQTNYIVAGWCYIISALLDAIDGHAARYFNQSEWTATVLINDFFFFWLFGVTQIGLSKRCCLIGFDFQLLLIFSWNVGFH